MGHRFLLEFLFLVSAIEALFSVVLLFVHHRLFRIFFWKKYDWIIETNLEDKKILTC
jgi:hypothetical protein